jgi:phosphoribosyl 1,2-cyclic phosphodiesterase
MGEEIRAKILAALKLWSQNNYPDPESFLDSLPPWRTGLVGGNTICLEISDDQDFLIFDAGTGLRSLGQTLISSTVYELLEQFITSENLPILSSPQMEDVPSQLFKLFMTHTHWDHIQGFPFFRPAYAPSCQIDIYGANKDELKAAFETQQSAPHLFPVPIEFMRAKITFHDFPKKGLKIGQFFIDSFPLPHPGGSLAFRIKRRDKKVVFATDYEIQKLDASPIHGRLELAEFVAGADLFISDTQYTYLDHATKEGWGHSNALSVVEMAAQAGVKSLYLFHHDPTYSDDKLLDILDKTRSYANLFQKEKAMAIELAMEGATIEL